MSDRRGQFVSGLRRENFRILDDGLEQSIAYFAPIEAPVTVLVLVETSPAVYLLHRQHLDAAYALLDGLAPDDQVALASYDKSTRLLLPFTTDKRALQAALGQLRYNLGSSDLRFYDALAQALRWLEAVPGKKALVILGTVLDTSGKDHAELVPGVVIHAVALGGGLREYEQNREEGRGETALSFGRADRMLRTISHSTGGRAFFPRSSKEFVGIYQQIATTLRNQYSLGFVPPKREGAYHRLVVQVVDENRVVGMSSAGAPLGAAHGKTVRHAVTPSRSGYRAPGPE